MISSLGGTMSISNACQILKSIADDHGEELLETVMYMDDNRSDFDPLEIQALDKFLQVGRAFFREAAEKGVFKKGLI